MDSDTQLLSAVEAAGRLGVGVSTLRIWMGQGKINCVRLGRRVLIRLSEVERFIKEHEENTRDGE
jgi:excisionase family DNA binding protein